MSGKSGAVALFLRNLPPNTSRKDLKSFVHRELQRAGVTGLPLFNLCTNCSILRVQGLGAGTIEYHGLVEVQPARIALLAIDILNGKQMHGAAIEVRRYRHRSQWGEHRQRSEPFLGGALLAVPLTERRRANLKIDLVERTPALPASQGQPALIS
jgi:hypothetical protein